MKHINKFKSDIDIYLMFPKCSLNVRELMKSWKETLEQQEVGQKPGKQKEINE